MALKFLNKKGWHTGSLRNIENVWKAEQKHDAEQRKLEELRKQIHEERERSEFRLLQEQAGLVPRQERLDFLYDSGLAVGKGSSDGFVALESLPPKAEPENPSSAANKASAPGALFEDKPQSANDAWRKLHSDPLLLIKQREQEALARVKNNPVQMALIHKSVEAKKLKKKSKEHKEKHDRKKSKHSSSKHSDDSVEEDRNMSSRKYKEKVQTERIRASDDSVGEREDRNTSSRKYKDERIRDSDRYQHERSHIRDSDRYQHERSHRDDGKRDFSSQSSKRYKEENFGGKRDEKDNFGGKGDRPPNRRSNTVKMSEEDRAAKLKEMQMDAEVHEEQRWKRLKQVAEDDAKEATRATSSGRNFLDEAHKSVFGAEKGGSATIEESVRRRTHYSQRRSEDNNAFRR